jgi:hypothetical protein
MSMKNTRKWLLLSFATLLMSSSHLFSQSETRTRTLVVSGHGGKATVVQMNGRTYVDLEMLVQAVNGSLAFQGNRIVLSVPSASGSAPAADLIASQPADTGFSKEFAAAAIESLGAMREWAAALAVTLKNGYPVGDGMADYRGRAGQSARLASLTAATPSDRSALQLLTTEFNNVQGWSDSLVKARNSMSAANVAMSENALLNDPLSQKILHCWQFLGPMLTSGAFQDDPMCH